MRFTYDRGVIEDDGGQEDIGDRMLVFKRVERVKETE